MLHCRVCGTMRYRLRVCSRCKSTRYHSTECQKWDWKRHKPECKQIQTLMHQDTPPQQAYHGRWFESDPMIQHVRCQGDSEAWFPADVCSLILSYCSWNGMVNLARVWKLKLDLASSKYMIHPLGGSADELECITCKHVTCKQLVWPWTGSRLVNCAHVRLVQIQCISHTHSSQLKLTFQVAEQDTSFVHLLEQWQNEFEVPTHEKAKWRRKYPMCRGRSVTIDTKLDSSCSSQAPPDHVGWRSVAHLEHSSRTPIPIGTLGTLQMCISGSMDRALSRKEWCFRLNLNPLVAIHRESIRDVGPLINRKSIKEALS